MTDNRLKATEFDYPGVLRSDKYQQEIGVDVQLRVSQRPWRSSGQG
jgi:hypothetical protein